jgi:hypothetical protein
MPLVSSHQIKPFTSPVNTTGAVDANLVRGNDNIVRNAYAAHDADATIHFQSSALASRPVAGVAGRKWMTEDAGVARLWYDTGTGWVELMIASNVVGPASATDNAIVRFDGTTGKLVQNSLVTITDGGAVTLPSGQVLTADQANVNAFQTRTAAGSMTIRTTSSSGGVFLQTNSTTRVTIAGADGVVTTTAYVNIDTADGLRVQGTKVVGAQGATISDPTGGIVQDSEARTAINALIDRLQAHGLIA